MARVIADLHPYLQELVSLLIKKCDAQGLKIGISECVRTVKEQNDLYAKGRTVGGSIVTNAKGTSYSSCHQWGIAFDFYRNDGKGAYNESGNFFEKVGKIGQSLNLEWGGTWVSIKDKPHFQLPIYGSSASTLKKLYTTPSNFMKSLDYKPSVTVTSKSSQKDVLWLQERLALCTGKDITLDKKFGKQVSNAIKIYWKQLDWNVAEPEENGFYKAGAKTIEALSQFRTK